MNPDHWGRVYSREGFAGAEPALRSVRRVRPRARRRRGLWRRSPEADLPGYRYMIGMERIDSMRNELASFTSFGEALKTVRANLAPRRGRHWRSTRWCCRKPGLAVIGVAMNDAETGEGWWAGKIGPTTWPPALRDLPHRRQGLRALRPLPHRAVVAGAGHGQFMRIARAPRPDPRDPSRASPAPQR